MTTRKERLTVTVDRALVRAATAAVASGRAASVSGWVNVALAEHAAKERRLAAMGAAIAAYEAEFGVIPAEEMAAQRREDRHRAIVVTPVARRTRAGRRRRRAA